MNQIGRKPMKYYDGLLVDAGNDVRKKAKKGKKVIYTINESEHELYT